MILRSILDGVDDGLEARAAEIFFRPQSVSDRARRGHARRPGDGRRRTRRSAGLGNVGRLLRELQAPLKSAELDVLDERNHARVLRRATSATISCSQMNPGAPGAAAFARVLETLDRAFPRRRRRASSPVREIPDEDWTWHVGLDAEATAMLNDIYNGGEVDEDRMKRIIGLFRAGVSRSGRGAAPSLRGAPVFLGLAMTPEATLRMKPQNLLMNLPLARRA